jgi:uncharacterized protein (TIGR02996 family)
MPAALDRAALLAAVCDDPASDVPRLVFADFLDEQGEAERSQFIRLQIDMERQHQLSGGLYVDTDEYEAAHAREVELFTWANIEAWSGHRFLRNYLSPRAYADSSVENCALWRRGFVACVTLPCADWLRHGAALVRACPLEGVRLAGKGPGKAHGHEEWFWSNFHTGPGRALDFYELPRPLFAALLPDLRCVRVRDGMIFDNRYYYSEADALAALSRACLRLARAGGGP